MKRMAVVLLAVLLAVGGLALAGCSTSDTDQAKQYMTSADKKSEEASALVKETSDIEGVLAQLGIDLATGSDVNWDKVIDEANKRIDAWIASGVAAKSEYKKILKLSDAEDYKKYAELKISTIDSMNKVYASLKGLLNELKKIPAGQSATDVVTKWAKANAAVAVNLGKAALSNKEANDLKESKNL